jgi:hypothetical protein
MIQGFTPVHRLDDDGNPAGGTTTGVGIEIRWQDGPLGRGLDRKQPNGAFVETLIAVAIDRIKFYEDTGFGCEENRQAIIGLENALTALNLRTARREHQGVEGTHEGT